MNQSLVIGNKWKFIYCIWCGKLLWCKLFDIINYMEFDGMYGNEIEYKMWQYGYLIDVLGVINDIMI